MRTPMPSANPRSCWTPSQLREENPITEAKYIKQWPTHDVSSAAVGSNARAASNHEERP